MTVESSNRNNKKHFHNNQTRRKYYIPLSFSFQKATNMSPPTLIYFDGPGRANLARLAFVAGGVEFMDQRVVFENWPEVKADPTSVPSKLFGQLPCIEHDGVMLAESMALSSYAAELGIWKGVSPADRATDIMVICACDGLKTAMYKCLFGDDESKAAGKEALPEAAEKVLITLEKIISRKTCEGPFFTSTSEPTLADLVIFDSVNSPFPGLKALGVDLSAYPKLVACSEAVGEIEKIKAFAANGFKL
jgi:glutathione S-transferase